ncbi:ABC transporter ATP-binding protein [Geodermatophilus normandii]|uniref:ABC transporter ATP-binding protein n=1 Tax=Geodermatophilus normandii TaxID=1137989 RepID=A0A6P0GEP6_9ACTN|nr:ABC transporter ATP-binding protein [Geodermatophilus normandii]NEM05728.1 ABC transporter ATP-binding protein [Geodermatophilus normandii]
MNATTDVAATVTDVTMRYREHTALDGVTTSFATDGITGLLGRNGAGKTTLMQLLTGHRVPTRGRVQVLGADPYENDAVLQRICFVKEGQRYPDHFRVRDALSAAATLFPSWDEDLARSLVADFQLPARRQVNKLSRGMVSAVGITIGLASRAPVTLFDEPYLGLDAVAREMFYDRLIADYAENPRTIVLSTHLIEEISGLLEHVLLIDSGRVLLDSAAEDLRASAMTVTGRADRVAALGREHEVLSTETLAGSSRAVVRLSRPLDDGDLEARGLTGEPTPLQQLVVSLSRHTATPSAPARTPDSRSADFEEVTR